VITVTSGIRTIDWYYGSSIYDQSGVVNGPVEQNLSATDEIYGNYSDQYGSTTYLFTHTATESNLNAQVVHLGYGEAFYVETVLEVNFTTTEPVNYEFTGSYASTYWQPGGRKDLKAFLYDGSNNTIYSEQDLLADASTAMLDDSGFIVNGSRIGVIGPGAYKVILWTRLSIDYGTNDNASGFENVRFWKSDVVPTKRTSWGAIKQLYR